MSSNELETPTCKLLEFSAEISIYFNLLLFTRYFGASIGVAGTTAVAVFRSPTLMKFVASQGLVAFGVSIAALLG